MGGVYFTDGVAEVLPIFQAKYGVPAEEVDAGLRGNTPSHQYRKGLLTMEKFWTPLKQQWKLNQPIKELSDLWASAYVPIKGTVEIVKKLNDAGYELIFLSNNIKERVEYLEKRYHFIHNFKDGVFSHLVHSMKPEKLIYELALKKAGNPASQSVFIDDKEKYLSQASELGMQTIWFQNPRQLEKDLKALGIRFN